MRHVSATGNQVGTITGKRQPKDTESSLFIILKMYRGPVRQSIIFLAAPTPRAASTTKMIASTRNKPNNTLAMPAEPAATPPKPRAPAIREMTAKMIAYLSMAKLQ